MLNVIGRIVVPTTGTAVVEATGSAATGLIGSVVVVWGAPDVDSAGIIVLNAVVVGTVEVVTGQ
jgi:hypothetical protein